MRLRMRSAGLVVEVEADGSWADLAREACAGQELPPDPDGPSADVCVRFEGRGGLRSALGSALGSALESARRSGNATTPASRRPGLRPLTRGAWSDGSTVVMADACASGLDLVLTPVGDQLRVVVTPGPSWRHRLLGLAAPDRRVLLHRAAALQYPVLWWAGVRGHVPVHVSAASVRDSAFVFAGPGGVGKSTLLATLDAADGIPVSDNLCVTDGRTVHGVLEPSRRDDATGRRMPHGRREGAWPRLAASLEPTAVIVLRRGQRTAAEIVPMTPAAAARELVGGTYAAGELRRYWAFAATAALGTGLGPAHPPVAAVCEQLAASTATVELHLPSPPSLDLDQVVDLVDGLLGDPLGDPLAKPQGDPLANPQGVPLEDPAVADLEWTVAQP